MGLFGPPNIDKMKAKRDIGGLIKALESARYRQAAAQALGQVGDGRAVKPLIGALRDRDGLVRSAAADALVKIGTPAVAPLVATLKGADSSVCLAAANALEKIGWQPGQDETGAVYWVLMGGWDKCVEIGAPAVESLIAAFKDRRGDRYQAVVCALGKIGDARAIGPLIAALDDEERALREAAVGALGQIGTPAVEPLIALLMERRGHKYRAAAEALVKVGTPAVGPLAAALMDGNSALREAGARVLNQIGDSRAVEPLIAVLKDADGSARLAAANALEKIGDARAVEPLVVALRDESIYVRRAAAGALSRIGWLPGQDEAGAVYWVFKGEWDKCVGIGAPAVEPLIAEIHVCFADTKRYAAAVRVLRQICAGQEDASLRARAERDIEAALRKRYPRGPKGWQEGLNYDQGKN
jgi:HEAT repeat protein